MISFLGIVEVLHLTNIIYNPQIITPVSMPNSREEKPIYVILGEDFEQPILSRLAGTGHIPSTILIVRSRVFFYYKI